MVIAAGSYPAGRWFESDRRYQKRPHGQAVKTSPFHGGNPSSSLGGVTKQREAALSERFFHKRITPHGGLAQLVRALALQARGHRFKSGSLHHLAARRISQTPCRKTLQGVCVNACGSVSARVPHSAIQSALHCAVLRATNARGCASRFPCKANFATPCRKALQGVCINACGSVSARVPHITPQSFLTPPCSVAVLCGDPV